MSISGVVRPTSARRCTPSKMAVWLLVAMATACLLGDTLGYSVQVDQRYQHIQPGTNFTFVCQADTPLVGCQVKDLPDTNVYDLSLGSRSRPSRGAYSGTGLESGQCGYTIVNGGTVGTYHPYSCRSRSRGGQWLYDTAVVEMPDPNIINGVLPLTTSPRTVLAHPGSDVTLTFAGGEPLSQCAFQWPGQTTWVYEGSTSAYSVDKSDFAGGRCRLTLKRVMSSLSGIVSSSVRSAATDGKRRVSMHLTTLIVKMAPGAPALSLSKTDGVYSEGDVMEASCHVGPARPVARVTWLLNDDVIQGEPEEFSTMPWEFEAGDVTRKLRRKLSSADDGKELVCRVEQVALPGGVVEARTKVTIRRVEDCVEGGVAGTALIAGGVDVAVGELPWHVGIYRSQGNDINNYTQICGGSLISKYIVISAAHCFWNEGQGKLMSRSKFKVAAGKRMRSWSHQDLGMQVRDVAAIHVPLRYRGWSGNLQNDIAVVRLSRNVDWTPEVQPVCMDWSSRLEASHLSAGVNGTVAGWGITHKGVYSEVLQKTQLPYVDVETCYNKLSSDTKRLFTDDKFCAGFVDKNTSVCPGDSGGGLVFATGNKFYLRGVVSVAFAPAGPRTACSTQLYSGFTQVSRHLAWIRGLVDA